MAVVSIKCPNCAAPLGFEIAGQAFKCQFCDSEFSSGDAQSFERQTDSEAQHWSPDEFSSDETVAYSCPSCGGSVLADKNTAATFCAFCHNPTILAAKIEGDYRPARIIPFKLEKARALESMQKLCKRKVLLPRDFRQAMEKGEITGLYVPFWLFSADVQVAYRAVGKRVSTWSDTRFIYTRTDIYHVERELELPLRLVPVDASTRMDSRLMDALEPFVYDDLIPFAMEYLSGSFAESYDVDSVQSAPRFRQRAEQGAKAAVSETTRGYTTVERPVMNTHLRHMDCVYVMLPVWTLMTQYRGKTYYLAMNGQTGKSAGKLPICAPKAFKLFGIIAAAVTVISFVGGLLLS